MKKFVLFVWQLPQNLLGMIVVAVTKAKKIRLHDTVVYVTESYRFGVSLGDYIIFGGTPSKTSIMHEQGHQKQSLILGWLYLLIIGLPSALGNLYDRWFHRNWSMRDSYDWYYNQPWEKWADYLGKVSR